MNSMRSMSRKEWKSMMENAISEWHFERRGSGVKPVAGKYDKNNPSHIKVSDVVKTYP